jgi:hypothetical protein
MLFMTIFEDSLNNSAAVSMQAEFFDKIRVVIHGLNYKIDILRHFLDAFLDDMISILIVNTVKNRIFKLKD